MDNTTFNNNLEKIIDKIKETLKCKGDEYSEQDDRLINFKHGAVLLGLLPEYYCRALQTKHTVSINDIIDKIDNGVEVPEALVWEKCIDEICYSILLLMILLERLNYE